MTIHVSVMPMEVLGLLDPQPGQVFVDCTLGAGGHARLIAERVGPTGRVIGLDRDPGMLAKARENLQGLSVETVHANFEDLADVLQKLQLEHVDGVVADLGFCSDQLSDPTRGLSFSQDGPLDMRLDPTSGESAASMVRRLQEKELADLIWEYGEERYSRRVARLIVETRKASPIETTAQLADLVRRCVPRPKGQRHQIDPATRVFQALRIAVNDELGSLERFLNVMPECLKPGGRAALISFHSLEDRLVKWAFRKDERLEILTKKPLEASDTEVSQNPRARSAKLRGAMRIAT